MWIDSWFLQANWVVKHFIVSPFNDQDILAQTVNHVMNSLCNDKELPVQVEAGIAVSEILERNDEGGKSFCDIATVTAMWSFVV